MKIERIVRVVVSLRTSGVRQQMFSDLMLFGTHAGADRVSTITGADDLLDDSYGLDTTSPLYLAALTAFSQLPGPELLYIGRRDAGETVTASLAACQDASQLWYGVADVTRDAANVLEIAAWAEANTKLFMAGIRDVSDTTMIGRLADEGYNRTSWWYHPDATEFPEIAVAANRFTRLPGSETWANVSLAGVTTTPISETTAGRILEYNGNTYEQARNLNITQGGRVASGQYVDTIRFRDWLCEEIRVRVFLALVNAESGKIPFTDAGIAAIRQAMMGALDLGVRRGGISPPQIDPETNKVVPSYTTRVPAAVQVSENDRAARVLRDVNFAAREAGSIHSTSIIGSLQF